MSTVALSGDALAAAAGNDERGGGVLRVAAGPDARGLRGGADRVRPGSGAAPHAADVGCVVAAPCKIERPAQDKVKTEQRDAERVLRLLMIDGLHAVRVPSVEEEALRDLVRARAGLRCDLMRAPAPGRVAGTDGGHSFGTGTDGGHSMAE